MKYILQIQFEYPHGISHDIYTKFTGILNDLAKRYEITITNIKVALDE